MFREKIYPILEQYRNQGAETLHSQGFTPKQLTLAGLAFTFLAGCPFATGTLFLGTMVALLAGFCDALDGPLARLSGKQSKFGAFLDSVIDRYSDFFLYGGLVLHFSYTGQAYCILMTLGAALGSFLTSYSKARAENFIKKCDVGIFSREIRFAVLLTGTLTQFLLPFALFVLFIGSNITAVQRILHTKKLLDEETPDGKKSKEKTGKDA